MKPTRRFKTVDEYIATFPPDVQAILWKIRDTIHEAAPEAEEVISYQIPAFKLNGMYLIYFAGWKNHIGFYPITSALKKEFQKELAKYKQTKGTVQIPLDQPMPFSVIKKIIRFQVKESLGKR